MSSPIIVAGIDVGGSAKGFHGVALRNGAYLGKSNSCDPVKLTNWCREIRACFVAVDAPCHWSLNGRARPAECALMKEKIGCFSTPTRERAENHPKDNFRWMLKGAELFANLVEAKYPLFNGAGRQQSRELCFETFPQAIACALAGQIVAAKQKRRIRRHLLNQANVDTRKLTNIDEIDAALCAFTAHQFAHDNYRCYGDAVGGFIVVPGRSLTSLGRYG